MRLIVCPNDSVVQLVNDRTGEVLDWDVSIFDRTRFFTIPDAFRDINEYWQFIGQERQEKIWSVYKQIHGLWYTVYDQTQLGKQLMDLLGQMYDLMPQEEMDFWVKFHAKVKYKEDLDHVLDPNDPNPGRTYLFSDYQGLVVLTIAVRPMVPIWGEYIARIKKDVGGIYKEYTAFKLLSKSWIIKSPYVERLQLYIESSNLHNASNVAAILSGLGTDELPEFLLAFVIVRRVAVGDIDATNTNGSIISNIYGFISSTLHDFDRRFGGGVKEKYPEDSTTEDESSMLEAYKVKQTVTMGDVGTFSVYVNDAMNMAKRLDLTVPEDMVVDCVASAISLEDLVIQQHHLTFCQWVLAPVMPPRSLPLLNKPTILRALGVTQALLWHWGFVELAALVTTAKIEQQKELTLTSDVKRRINAELTDKLNALYPYTDPNEKQGSSRKANFAYSAILTLTDKIALNPWQVNAPPALIAACPTISHRGVMTCPANLVEQLTHLILRINATQTPVEA